MWSPARRRLVARLGVCSILLLLSCRAAADAPKAEREDIRRRLSGLSVPFIVNEGQLDPAVAYYAPTFAGTVYVTREGWIVHSLSAGKTDGETSRGWSLTETVIGGRPRPSGQGPAETRVSTFIGNDPAHWRSGIVTYESVSLGEVWPGVSVSLRAQGNNVEKLFTVGPGADPSRIRMRVGGARSLRVDPSGELIAATGLGDVVFTPPAAWQQRDGARRPVPVAYRLRGGEYGFRLGEHDPDLPVVIDPLLQATYLGGSSGDTALAMGIDATSGDVFLAGPTDSANFPGTAGGAQPVYSGGFGDAFVARVNATLTTLARATYLGGNSLDTAYALAIHPTTGDVFIAGLTSSANFPGTIGGAQPSIDGPSDAFVARLNAGLTTLSRATYLGGAGEEFAFGLAIQPTSGEVVVAGETRSTNFPGTVGGAQPGSGGGFSDGFLARLDASLTTLAQATYLGGDSSDETLTLAIHSTSGEVLVAGRTFSTNFPATTGGARPVGGNGDAFVGRLNAALTTLSQATYLGGSLEDAALALAINPISGDLVVAGRTGSTDFPGTAGGAQPASPSPQDAFVARLNAGLTTLAQATYLGGKSYDIAYALVIHPTSGEVFVAGATSSTDFPGTAGGAQVALGGLVSSDAFVARLNPALSTVVQASYLGGGDFDYAFALAIHPISGAAVVAGQTSSTNFPGTPGGAQPAYGGGDLDAFVARMSADLAGGGVPTPTPTPFAAPPADVPTLSPRMLVLLAIALASLAVFVLNRTR